jgi:hypothetical protein
MRLKMKNLLKERKGQLTIFVILAILIIVVLAIIFYPTIKKALIPKTPVDFIPKDCIEKSVSDALAINLLKGGSFSPKLFFMYNNETLDYLCYTGEWYKTCSMQKPFLKQSIEKEIENYTRSGVKKCIDNMKATLVSNGYSVTINGSENPILDINPNGVGVSLDIEMQTQKADVTEKFDSSKFKVSFNSGVYNLIMIASSIQNFEARYGDTIPEDYMTLYPNIKVEKLKQSDGTKVYILTDRDTNEKLQFAIRSISWPPGYAI